MAKIVKARIGALKRKSAGEIKDRSTNAIDMAPANLSPGPIFIVWNTVFDSVNLASPV